MVKKASKSPKKKKTAFLILDVEKEKEKLIKEMQEEIRMEKSREEQLELLEDSQAMVREEQLEETQKVLREHQMAQNKQTRLAEQEENWLRYTSCDGLPDPTLLPDINTFLFFWTNEIERASLPSLPEKYDVVIVLLHQLRDNARLARTPTEEYAAEYRQIARELGDKLNRWIDIGCYRVLRQIETDMTREGRTTARYVIASSRVVCCLWTPIVLPVGMKPVAEKDRKPIEVRFDELGLTITMPADMDCYGMAIRGAWLAYDPYSEHARSKGIPEVPEKYLWDCDLLEFCQREKLRKLQIREEQLVERRLQYEEKKTLLGRMERPLTGSLINEKRGKQSKRFAGRRKRKMDADASSGSGSKASAPGRFPISSVTSASTELPYLPTPEEIIRKKEDETKREIRKMQFLLCEKTEINLRKYKILGGVYRVDLVYQPPQPKDIGNDMLLTTLELPKEVKYVPFRRAYEPPSAAPDSERTPEVIEAEMKALEAAMEALALVVLKLPGTVLWFEPPLVAHWIPERKIWSTRDIYDIKYNEEKQTISFRTGRTGIHALAAYKFVHLPFQNWELKPEIGRNSRGGVILSLTAATVQVEFIVRKNAVCLNSIVGGMTVGLKQILGEYMELRVLIERMREAGCDLFPEADAPSYVNGLATKHPVAEKHLQQCMALLCTAYSFAWSRWNGTRGFREIVIQTKELHGCVAKERTNSMTVLITPTRSVAVCCTEVSSEFSDLPLDPEKDEFYADLYHLAIHTAGIKTRQLVESISFELVVTVTQLLKHTNLISMST